MNPKRFQLRRTKGWRKPDNTVVVSRPTVWGNPFTVELCGSAGEAVRRFSHWVTVEPKGQELASEARAALRGKNLACWCKLSEPCHADVLLEVANK